MCCQVCNVRSGEGRQNLFVLGFYVPSTARGSPQDDEKEKDNNKKKTEVYDVGVGGMGGGG